MAKKDKKSKVAEKKVRVAQKQEKKASQKDKKSKTKSRDDDSDAEDVDLDAVLAEYAKQQEQFLKVTESPWRGIQFGGVHDVEESEEGIDSEFFNTLYAWNIERNRYFQLTLRRPRGPPKKQQQQGAERGRRGRGKADEEELLRNLAALESKGSIAAAADGEVSEPAAEVEDLPAKPEKTTTFEMPHPRFNAQLAEQDDVLYIFGGTFEKGDREYTFDE
ncbi:hypothetical protein B0A49_08433, partial [Cryomyces minteri]